MSGAPRVDPIDTPHPATSTHRNSNGAQTSSAREGTQRTSAFGRRLRAACGNGVADEVEPSDRRRTVSGPAHMPGSRKLPDPCGKQRGTPGFDERWGRIRGQLDWAHEDRPGKAPERREIRRECCPECRSEMGGLGSELGGSLHCTGTAVAVHWHSTTQVRLSRCTVTLCTCTGTALVLHQCDAKTVLVLYGYCSGTALVALHWYCTVLALCCHNTGTALVLCQCCTGTILVLRR